MAIRLSNLSDDGFIEVVASADDALDMTTAEYAEYLKNNDASLLKLKDGREPTVFVLKKVLKWATSQKIKNRQMTYEDGQTFVGVGHISDEIRHCLVGIKNPESVTDGLKFKKSADGAVDPELMSLLDAAGVTPDLYTARRNYIEKISNSDALKKS